jgi:hypothetical protein
MHSASKLSSPTPLKLPDIKINMYQSSHDTDTYLFLHTTHLVNFDSCKKYLLILRSDFLLWNGVKCTHTHTHTEINKLTKKEREKTNYWYFMPTKQKWQVRLHFSSLHLCTSTLLFLMLFQKINNSTFMHETGLTGLTCTVRQWYTRARKYKLINFFTILHTCYTQYKLRHTTLTKNELQ